MNPQAILHNLGIVNYNESRDEFVADCILCEDKKKNLQINFRKRLFHCWVCNEGGNLAKLIILIRGGTVAQANKLFRLDDIDEEYETENILSILRGSKKKKYNYHRYLVSRRYDIWYKIRQINYDIVYQYNLGFDSLSRRLVIPIFDENNCIALIRRSIDNDQVPKYLYTKGFLKSETLYGWHNVDLEDDSIFICEGPMDVFGLKQLNFNTIALLGLHISQKMIDIIVRNFQNVIFALDNDLAGEEALSKLVPTFESDTDVFRLIYDAGDPGDIQNMSQIKGIKPIALL